MYRFQSASTARLCGSSKAASVRALPSVDACVPVPATVSKTSVSRFSFFTTWLPLSVSYSSMQVQHKQHFDWHTQGRGISEPVGSFKGSTAKVKKGSIIQKIIVKQACIAQGFASSRESIMQSMPLETLK